MKIVIDAMGADNGVAPVLLGVRDAITTDEITDDFSVILVGDEREILNFSPEFSQNSRIKIVHAENFIKMTEPSTNALKNKNSSIYMAMQILKNDEANALISAGHSGATMSLATLMLGRVNGVSRPAICTMMPTVKKRPSLILDAGANTDCKPEFLVDFARMGQIYCEHFLNREPKIGLLANGEEDSKGNELTKDVFKILKNDAFFAKTFIGNVEGNDIFKGDVDVIVCDGYSGNIVLKASEGVANAIFRILKNEISQNLLSKIGALFLRKSFRTLKNEVDYAEYGGAPLLGVRGNVIISHGKSNARAITCAIKQAVKISQKNIIEHLSAAFLKK